MAHSSPSQLPVEIWELIIDFRAQDDIVGDPDSWVPERDFKNILACALTCRAWLPRSRHHLLQERIISSGSQLATFASVVHKYGNDITNWWKLLLLEPTNSSPQAWLSSVPIRLSSALHGLHTLQFSGVDFFQLNIRSMAGFGLCCNVTRLVLQDVTFGRTEHITRLLLAFRRLGDLALWAVNVLDHSNLERPERCLLLPSLFAFSLLVPDPTTHLALANLLASSNPPKLYCITMHQQWCQSIQAAQAVARFLKACPALHCLTFDIDREEMLAHFSLEPCVLLNRLTVYFLESTGTPLVSTLPRILRGVSAPTINQLSIIAAIPSVEQFDLIPWTEIADILTHPPFKNLTSLSVTFVPSNPTDGSRTSEVYQVRFREIMKQEMAAVDQKIIRFDV